MLVLEGGEETLFPENTLGFGSMQDMIYVPFTNTQEFEREHIFSYARMFIIEHSSARALHKHNLST